MSVTVTTQAELDKALADKGGVIYIDSPRGVRIYINATGSSSVVARGSSSVVARGSSSVVAWGSSSVVARGSSSVVAWGSSSVVAWGSSSVVARDSSSVEAWGSSSVEAWDSSSVVAWDSSSVVAWGSSSVVAWGSSSVEAGRYVALRLHSQRVTHSGGVVIDMTSIDRDDPATWCDLRGAKVTDGRVTFYKAVDADLVAGHSYTPTTYPIGEEVTCGDWDPARYCGNGLHFSPHPLEARRYYGGAGAPRFLEVTVALSDMVPLGDKVKSPSCVVVREVDHMRRPLTTEAVKA